MLIVYDSRTGNVERFVRKLGMKAIKIDDLPDVDEPFVLVTYTTGFGQAPERAAAFAERNAAWLRGVSASGNRNWGTNFARSADVLAARHRVPVVAKFELSGTESDIIHFAEGVKRLAAY